MSQLSETTSLPEHDCADYEKKVHSLAQEEERKPTLFVGAATTEVQIKNECYVMLPVQGHNYHKTQGSHRLSS